jgi:hypothetical protein
MQERGLHRLLNKITKVNKYAEQSKRLHAKGKTPNSRQC